MWKIDQNIFQNFSFCVSWKKVSQTRFEWGRINTDRIFWVNYSFNRLIHCLSCNWILFLMWFFYLLITLCTRLVEIKGELQSSRRNLKLKGSVSLSISFLCFSNTPADTTQHRLGKGMPLPPFSIIMLALFIWLVSDTANKAGRKMTRRWLN